MTQHNWGIVIGINQYEHLSQNDHLRYAVSDAIAMQNFLCDRARFPRDNVLVCCDDASGSLSSRWRPNRTGLRDLLRHQLRRACDADNLWFFFAGHGIVYNHQDFLLPCDGNPNDLEDTAVSISFVTDCLQDCGAKNVVLVLDMCRNRTTDEGTRGWGMDEMSVQTAAITREQGMVTLFSCSRGERSYEIAELNHGAFTYALLEGLQQGTTPRFLQEHLRREVPALNRRYQQHVQTPRVVLVPASRYNSPLLLGTVVDTVPSATRDFFPHHSIPHPRHFFGRESVLERIFDSLRRHPLHSVVVIGDKQSGKTSLLHYIQSITQHSAAELRRERGHDWLNQPEQYRWVYIRLNDFRYQTESSLLRRILNLLQLHVPDPCKIDGFMDVMEENLQQPTVIMFDEIGVGLRQCPELNENFWKHLRSLASSIDVKGNLAYIYATSDERSVLYRHLGGSSPLFNLGCDEIQLEALEEQEARILIASSPQTFDDKDVEWILVNSECKPLWLQIICNERLRSLQSGGNSHWKAEALRQIDIRRRDLFESDS
jgi:Caspase domain